MHDVSVQQQIYGGRKVGVVNVNCSVDMQIHSATAGWTNSASYVAINTQA